MVNGSPQCARGIHTIAVGLDVDAEVSLVTETQGGTDRGGKVITYAETARTADSRLIVFINRPEFSHPFGMAAGNQRPVFVADGMPDFSMQPRGRDGRGVPAQSSFIPIAGERFWTCVSQAFATCGD